jgi:NAD(P)-dependent dehydrogenase (short-subunit alcohol dehydrogenase family)
VTSAIVTGSGRSIGRAVAIMLAQKGVDVAVCSRTSREVDETVTQIAKIHRGVIGMACDVGIASQVDALVSRTADKFGGVDILVNNAAVLYLKKLADTTEQEWDQTINSNLKSAFLCCRAVLPYMAKAGTIINVSSVAGKTGFENLSAYCASKFGMIGLTESLSWEVQGRTRVMAICPGDVDTAMQDVDPEYHRANKGRMLTAEQVALKIVEMIFDAKYRNGQSIDI